MSIIVEIAAALLVAALLFAAFVRASPAALASAIRLVPPLLLGATGFAAVAVGRAAAGGLMVALALAWLAATHLARKAPAPQKRRAMVRTAALEMELDHETGGLDGVVLAGSCEGRELATMAKNELVALYRELGGDFESRQLLEAYLDSRFAVWCKNAKADHGKRLGGAPGAGPMTKEEAYKVLGLEAGAAAADVRKAHRRLMQRLHPDIGGSSVLAARINEAKDVLLSNHN
jgi:hypothetical protein